jgi:hypothetical protein
MKLKDPTHGALPVFLAMLTAIFVMVCCAGCASTPTTWQAQLAPDSLANKAVVNVANHYGGQKAAELASAGLYAAADVLQGYVDKKPPIDVITQSPGVEGVGHLIVGYLKDKGVITQKTVDNLHKAAAFAARVTYTTDPK